MKKILLWCTMLTTVWLSAQTSHIPTAQGGFEVGDTFASNGWSSDSGAATNKWVVGPLASGPGTGNAAFITNSAAAPYTPTYTLTSASVVYFWRDITIPAGESKIKLDFDWIGQGESTWDFIQVLVAPTTVTPDPSTSSAGSISTTPVPSGVQGATSMGYFNLQGSTQHATLYLPPSLAGTTFRLIFSWRNDTGGGNTISGQIDNISLVSSSSGNYVSAGTGDWNNPATWDINDVPSPLDNVTISAGDQVTINANNLGANNLVVNGTLSYGSTPTIFAVNGNLSVAPAGVVNVFNGTTGKTLSVAGDIVNNGVINVSVGSTTAGVLTLNGTSPQTYSGTGIFENGKIRNLTLANTSAVTPNITFNSDIRVVYNLSMTGARVAMGTNKLTFGDTNAVGSTLTAPSGSGLVSGKFVRYYATSTTGSTITAGALPTATTTKYPFVTMNGQDRSMWITRTNTSGAAAGELGVVYNNITGVSNVSIVDGTYTVDRRTNANWVVTNETGTINSSSYRIAMAGDGLFAATNGEHRIVSASSVVGDHQNGTAAPSAQRVALQQADLLAGPLYLGYNDAASPFEAIANGDWNATTTWNKGSVPTCTSEVVIGSGYTVTVNSAAQTALKVNVRLGGNLVIASGDLTVGCTDNNATLTNEGSLSVTGGTLNMNGNLWNAAGSSLSQSGGNIVIDGNNGGSATGSVASGTALLHMASNDVNMTGGVLTIVDPHAASTASNTINYTYGTSGNVTFSPNHTLRLGDGVSTDAGGNLANGFRINTYASSGRISKFGKLEINALAGANRHVTTSYIFGVHDLEIHADSQLRMNSTSLYIAGNFVNNGLYVSSTTTYLSDYSTASSTLATDSAQTISGNGQFHNSSITVATLPTINNVMYSLTVVNSNPAGVTLARPLGLSNTLTLTEGVVHTSAANLLSVGFGTTTGTMTTGSNTAYINGPVSKVFANNYTSAQLFPIGKGGSYSPIWISPKTTAVSTFTAEAFDSNTGSLPASLTNLATDRRWEVSLGSGSYSTIKVKVGSANIAGSNVIVQAPTANGLYENAFGAATYADATTTVPATIEGVNEIDAADFTGFVSYATPGCPAPTSIETVATTTSVEVSWTGNAQAANGYQVYYSPVNTAPNASTVLDATNSVTTTGSSVTIPGLTPETAYYIWVRSLCSATSSSDWAGSYLAFTGYCPVTTTNQNTWFTSFTSTGATTNLNYTSATAVSGTNGYQNLSATHTLANYAGSTTPIAFTIGSGSAGVAVWIDWNNDLVFDATERVYNTTSYTNGTNSTITVPSGTALGNYRMRMVVNYNLSNPTDPCLVFTRGEYLDMNFQVVAAPTCLNPTALAVSAVTSNSATISWTAPATVPANGYEVYYSTSNVEPTATTVLDATNSVTSATTSANLTGLNASSTYYVWVRSVCSTTDSSIWSSYVSFPTACGIVTSIDENFDSYTSASGSLPNCWVVLPGASTSWTRINNGQSFSPNNGLYLYGGLDDLQGVSLPPVSGLDSGNLSLQFKLRTSSTTSLGTVKVGYLDPANNNQIEPLTSFVTTASWVTHTVSLTGIPTGVTQLVLYQDSGVSAALYIDDVKVALTSSLSASEVKSVKAKEVNVYPNPFKDVINISNAKDLKSVAVVDASGRVLRTIANPEVQINLGDLKSGMYILTLTSKDGTVSSVKVIKK